MELEGISGASLYSDLDNYNEQQLSGSCYQGMLQPDEEARFLDDRNHSIGCNRLFAPRTLTKKA